MKSKGASIEYNWGNTAGSRQFILKNFKQNFIINNLAPNIT